MRRGGGEAGPCMADKERGEAARAAANSIKGKECPGKIKLDKNKEKNLKSLY